MARIEPKNFVLVRMLFRSSKTVSALLQDVAFLPARLDVEGI
jgi:hypothetical protein